MLFDTMLKYGATLNFKEYNFQISTMIHRGDNRNTKLAAVGFSLLLNILIDDLIQ